MKFVLLFLTTLLVKNQYNGDYIDFQGDFASGFASQSLPLTWGTGPR